jgi:pilus assembly protein TadC
VEAWEARWREEQLASASPDLLREMATMFANAMMSIPRIVETVS